MPAHADASFRTFFDSFRARFLSLSPSDASRHYCRHSPLLIAAFRRHFAASLPPPFHFAYFAAIDISSFSIAADAADAASWRHISRLSAASAGLAAELSHYAEIIDAFACR